MIALKQTRKEKRRLEFEKVDFSPTAKLPILDKHANSAATGIGVFLSWQAFGYYLMYFYTDVAGISAIIAGSIMLFARVFDAITDLCIGYCIDRFNFKWGKFRSWVRWSTLPQLICFILVFTHIPGASKTFTHILAWISYGSYGAICATLCYIPLQCQTVNMTRNVDERASIAGFKGFYENIGILLIAVAYMPLIRYFAGPTENLSRGFFIATFIFACIALATVVWDVRATEKYELNEDGSYRPHLQVVKERKREKLSVLLKSLLSNRPAMITVFGGLFLYILQAVRAGMVVYLYEYYFELPQLTAIALFFNCGLAMIGALLVKYVIRLFKDSNRAYIGTAFLSAGIYLVYYLIIRSMSIEAAQASMNFGPLFFLFAACGLLQGIYYIFPNVMLPNTVDYGTWKTGRNQSGFIYSAFGCLFTLGSAFGGQLLGLLLNKTGYIPNVVQPEATLRNMLTVGVLVPVLLTCAHAVIQMFFGLTDKQHQKYVEEINERYGKGSVEIKDEDILPV
jgi:sugar (glycoside-pentoside-hexuronide) transporter